MDGSNDMLLKAQEKARQAGADILYLAQDMRELDLYGTVSGAVCTLDGLNHLPDENSLALVMGRLKLFVEPGGLFLFDLNTAYKQEQVLGDNCFVYEDEQEDILCVWRNQYDPDRMATDIMLDFFIPAGEGLYERASEDLTERYYPPEVIRSLLEQSGFSLEAIYDDMTADAPRPDSQRVTYVAKRMG